jgi:putative ABC transport system ATP-binding protein
LNGTVLVVQDVGFSYRLSRRSFSSPVLKRIRLTVRKGEILVLVGHSGAGKSSFLRLLNRLEDPVEGKIFLDGIDLADRDPQQLRREVALVLQEPFLMAGTVRTNLLLPFEGEASSRDRVGKMEKVLRSVGLSPDFLSRPVEELSIGERQRVCIARTLMTSPRIMLLDEPTSSLDRENRELLSQTIRRINQTQAITFVIVTHSQTFADSLGGRKVDMQRGEILPA